ncbi:hypothetical protein F5Y17DRAFT_455214 [Xylariaceae sp. FL0594]|nr:hypothetical protein F5Y17DRAFT_455214 [Xylariaceae sp. FL0594]
MVTPNINEIAVVFLPDGSRPPDPRSIEARVMFYSLYRWYDKWLPPPRVLAAAPEVPTEVKKQVDELVENAAVGDFRGFRAFERPMMSVIPLICLDLKEQFEQHCANTYYQQLKDGCLDPSLTQNTSVSGIADHLKTIANQFLMFQDNKISITSPIFSTEPERMKKIANELLETGGDLGGKIGGDRTGEDLGGDSDFAKHPSPSGHSSTGN